MRHAAALLALPLAACTTLPAPGLPVSGSWGGTHVGLTLLESGGRLDYDCAAGTIGPVIPRPGGRFVADGTHTPGWGGPDIQGQLRPTHRVRFSGTIAGHRMTLVGSVANGVQLGPFALRRGAEPVIMRCL